MKNKRLLALLTAFIIFFIPLPSYAQTNIDSSLNTIYSNVPYEIRASFDNDGWNMDVVDAQTLNALYGYGQGDIAGITVYDDKAIYLSSNRGYAKQAINHEMGHYFEDAYLRYFGVTLSQTPEFANIYSSEAHTSKLFSSYTLSSYEEYFAQAFKGFCDNPYALSKQYPNTYNYILSAYNNFAANYNSSYNLQGRSNRPAPPNREPIPAPLH